MTAPIVHLFDEENYFICSKEAQQSPFKEGKYLFPEQSTAVAPDIPDGYFAKWNGTAWEYEKKPEKVEDFLGVKVSHQSQTERNIELRQLIQKLAEESTEYQIVRGTEEEGLWWSVEKIPEKTELEKKRERISELKGKLYSSDYVVMKIAEGVATEDEYAGVLNDRKEWRAEINQLEAEIVALEEK